MRRHESAAVFLTNLYLWGIIKVAKSAGVAILSSVGSEYLDVAKDMANEIGSAADVLMEYDESIGEALKKFFDYLIIALAA